MTAVNVGLKLRSFEPRREVMLETLTAIRRAPGCIGTSTLAIGMKQNSRRCTKQGTNPERFQATQHTESLTMCDTFLWSQICPA
jgi:hypothetical protein